LIWSNWDIDSVLRGDEAARDLRRRDFDEDVEREAERKRRVEPTKREEAVRREEEDMFGNVKELGRLLC
jgi:hypothetical protein